jgi:quinolinate synthase
MKMDIKLLTDVEKQSIGERQPIPERYLRLADDEMDVRIAEAKRTLGERLVVLGHHYQRDEVIKFADYTGDSLKLARLAASRGAAEFIVFCGVHFMAESADILRAPHQKVVLPDLAAGCSMADMASPDQLEICWRELREMGVRTDAPGPDGRAGVIPVTYINSSAGIKAFCGEHGGIVCTSTNAKAVMTWAWERGEKVLMLPDQHLGRNTAFKMGVPLDQMVVWDPEEVWGGLDPDKVRNAQLILWKGFCSVHTRFTVAQIDAFRQKYPQGRVVAHPECTFDVVQAADESGSTEYIVNTVKNSPAGTVWAVATEIHLVNRLSREAPDKTIVTLDPFGCLCSTMFRVSPNHLLWTLEGLVNGVIHNQIVVPEPARSHARLALDRMLEVKA